MATKLKIDPSDFNVKELDVEWSDKDFSNYEGEQPPSGTVLNGYVKKMWWTYAADETPMIKVLWIADGNTGDREQYNGLDIWDNLVFKPTAAFKYGPFLLALGLTLKQVFSSTYVSDDDDPNMGAPIEKIAKVEPGDEGDARCGVVTKREKYKGEWSTKVGKFCDEVDQEDDDEEEDDEEEVTPTRSRKPAAKSAASSKPGAAKRRRTEPEPDDEDDDEEEADDDEEDDDEPPAKPARKASRTKPAASKKPAQRGRKSKDDDDDDPF